ncbi:discoidin domain-containing protein [Paenibacillus sp. FA6]|uniref:discoidin domain-containing protein n=1 Tax=Paenibacillus sp. FA6 TaxID=3413029 RepID=UPI003F65721C
MVMKLSFSVDLGSEVIFNRVIFKLNHADNLEGYQLLYSNDQTTWNEVYCKNNNMCVAESASFATVSARYLKLNLNPGKDLNVQLSELAVYNNTEAPAPTNLKRIFIADSMGIEYPNNSEFRLNKGGEGVLHLKGELKSGSIVDLQDVVKSFKSSTMNVSVSPSGKVTANQVGASLIQAGVQSSKDLKSDSLWVVVDNPVTFQDEARVAISTLKHPRMKIEIGQPAVLEPKDVFPMVSLTLTVNGQVAGELIFNGTQLVAELPETSLVKGHAVEWTPSGTAVRMGSYELRMIIKQDGKPPRYDSFYFTVLDPKSISPGHSQIAFLGKDGNMVYIGDYRGNRILDFSNVGYKGGGVKIPDVPIKATVSPADCDATARIQAAIDELAKLPLDKDGIRGAVLLKKGRYEVGGTLIVKASGIVLRGEGQDEEGTLIYGTGAIPRNLIEIGESADLTLDSSSKQTISDLYVPSGSRTFHVEDGSAYFINDQIVVRRIGNENWIHEISMDYIYNRPGGSVIQWSPFNLDFDRVITAIEGNTITVDAPLASAIEFQWGGGEIYKYTDSARIQQVGVENMRVESEFDPSIMDTAIDSDTTDPYYADENHAERFVVFNSVKNGWVRDVTGYHLSYSLVQMSRNSKWITVQDSKMYDMVSVIIGGRRYVIHQMGQLNLTQRIYTETARHAFAIDSWVSGPNVFLDSKTVKNYNTSEPHHRWSVGGLFDNIKAPISIRDRAWLGTGHGWAGANYVTWNTQGELTSQRPPTAQNYSIGHVGRKVPGLVPNNYDPRPRSDGYWDNCGQHVIMQSLYKQQLMERLGRNALNNIKK